MRLASHDQRVDADVRSAVGDQHDRARRSFAADLGNRLQLVHSGQDRIADGRATAELRQPPDGGLGEDMIGRRRLQDGRRPGEREQPDLNAAGHGREEVPRGALRGLLAGRRDIGRLHRGRDVVDEHDRAIGHRLGDRPLGASRGHDQYRERERERDHRRMAAPPRARGSNRRGQRRRDERRRRPVRGAAADPSTTRSAAGSRAARSARLAGAAKLMDPRTGGVASGSRPSTQRSLGSR